jgi:hypothetical protein
MTDKTQDDIDFLIQKDRERVQKILSLPEAQGARQPLARILALVANMDTEEARLTLAAAPDGAMEMVAGTTAEPIFAEAAMWNAAALQAMRVDDGSDEAAGRRAAERLLGKNGAIDSPVKNDLSNREDDNSTRAQVWQPSSAELAQYAEGEQVARRFMSLGFGRRGQL